MNAQPICTAKEETNKASVTVANPRVPQCGIRSSFYYLFLMEVLKPWELWKREVDVYRY